jgi:uncharacterized protein (TIGR00270 family)
MVTCEFCGKEVNSTVTVKVAGSTMQACFSCKGMGEVIEKQKLDPTHTFYKRKKQTEVALDVVSNYSSLLNSALAKKGLNIKQLARALNIRESTINKYFTNKMKPDVETAKKLGKYLDVYILEEAVQISAQDYMGDVEYSDDENLSLGDLLIKKMGEKK